MTQRKKDLEFLKTTELFQGMNVGGMEYGMCNLKKGSLVSNRYQGEKSIGIVVTGEITVSSFTPDGKELTLRQIYPKDCFGICTVLTQAEMPNTLQCMCPTTVLYIKKSELLKVLKRDPELMLHIMTIFNKKILFLQKKVEMLNTTSAKARLADYLVSHANSNGVVSLRTGKTGLCSCLGISRATLYRELDNFRISQAIEYTEQKIVIRDVSHLRQFSQCHLDSKAASC
ncbi:Crp/Fnr family transcriptional regulator [Lacrimispora sphenoides]|uniref:cAMP-binding domain of CRP or a regulatory subunit of cAMP-dependent protein kinases n=1 Tax=Lacrimispora sphenoides JCM 1415 TaxID=1297793 RepID=A0ABY1C0Z2_9FIRM|nr:Crp/Fnr family transcriptional regulator [Lacrimispora sphenoides]SET50320.1 cAMP-binding domain of CRP or a regulatory subunit of cAMP-dependent protein kinases [[Clostridium] sphenoides JCM 1415]SUY49492.1 cyclic nucleotide-binding protein [Lacrimispora sphenoides]